MSLVNRRHVLGALAASPIASLGIGAFPSSARAQAQAIGLITPNVCMVMPEVTEGPYYLDENLVRADITEDRQGIPMRLQMQVVTADCQPIENARVDVWHCDAEGNYSGYANQGSDGVLDTSDQVFLRGTQMTKADGTVTFQTIYPGWYRGRTTHIHYKVYLDEKTLLTSQIFFPDALSEYLFQSVTPYNNRKAKRDTTNSNDWIASEAGSGAYAAVREQPEYYDAALVVGVATDAVSVPASMPGGAGGPPPGGPSGAGPQDGTNSAEVFVPSKT